MDLFKKWRNDLDALEMILVNGNHGRKYFWLTGEFVNFDKGKDTDVWALANNYISVVPVQFDMTNYVLKSKFEKTWQHLS